MSRQRTHCPAQRQRDDGQAQDAFAGNPQVAKIEREAALEDNDSDRQADNRLERRSQGSRWSQNAQSGSGEKPRRKEKDDSRQPEPPSQPLGGNSAYRDT